MSVLGNASRNLINLTGKYSWDGHAWVKYSAHGATASDDLISGLGGDDTIASGSGNDQLHGNEGNDRLTGGLGDDNLYGENGDDWLFGGRGADAYVGGAGSDTFVFRNLADSAADDVGRFIDFKGDVIRDFTSAAESSHHDMIDLKGIAASVHHALTWVGNKGIGKAWGVWSGNYGDNTYLSVDGTGDGTADLVVKFSTLEKLGKADFFLL